MNNNYTPSNFKYTDHQITANDWASDTFFGTNTMSNKEDLNKINEMNKFNEHMFNKGNEFNKYMSDTQYQRGTADMIKAGYNPMVMSSLGNAGKASTPTSQSTSSGSSSKSSQNGVFKDVVNKTFDFGFKVLDKIFL